MEHCSSERNLLIISKTNLFVKITMSLDLWLLLRVIFIFKLIDNILSPSSKISTRGQITCK